jgi:molybdenum cofactor cytidylyltransferase
MDLTDAFQLVAGEVVVLVGGGGKTTTMYRLCREAAGRGRSAVATGTARFTRPARMPAPVLDEDEGRLVAQVRRRLSAGEPWLIVATGLGSKGRLLPVSFETVTALAAARTGLVAVEADGSALRPFKAPAQHEPVVPPSATIVIAVTGADVFGKTLASENVHRPERVSALTGARSGEVVTPAMVAAVLAHAEGGRKNVPPGARFAVLINKVSRPRAGVAREAARLLLEAGVARVVLAQARASDPVVEVFGA